MNKIMRRRIKKKIRIKKRKGKEKLLKQKRS